MEDAELVNVAAFKLQDSANRMLTLAKAARSPRLRARLLSLSKQLISYESRLRELAGPEMRIGLHGTHAQTAQAALQERINKAAGRSR